MFVAGREKKTTNKWTDSNALINSSIDHVQTAQKLLDIYSFQLDLTGITYPDSNNVAPPRKLGQNN